MNILFVMLLFPKMSEASLYTSLVLEFKQQGHAVFPVAPTLKDQTKTGICEENGINVLRVKSIDLFDSNLIKKGLANILLPFCYKKAIKKYWGNIHIDLIIVPTPSVMFADLAASLAHLFKSKVYLMLKDIFPQNAVDLGLIKKKGLAYTFFHSKEVKLYNTADWIGCTSKGNIDYISRHHNIPLNKLHVLSNCSSPINMNNLHASEIIKRKYNLEGKFTAVFGGNMGIPQQMENIISLADKCQIFNDVIFLIIGKGTQTERIRLMAKERNISNIAIINYVLNDEYRSLLASCDIGLISLNQNFTVPNTPYKLNDYWALKIPVLASIDHATDLDEILRDNNAGLFAYADDISDLFIQFKVLYNNENLRKEMGVNGYEFFKKNMTTEVAYKIIMSYVL